MPERYLYDCDNCGYSWTPRSTTPRKCPDCGSRDIHVNQGPAGRLNRGCMSCMGTLLGAAIVLWIVVALLRNLPTGPPSADPPKPSPQQPQPPQPRPDGPPPSDPPSPESEELARLIGQWAAAQKADPGPDGTVTNREAVGEIPSGHITYGRDGSVQVKGYYNKHGTWVAPHARSAPGTGVGSKSGGRRR